MERVLGIGGYFLRATDPGALGDWYREHLGLDVDEHGLWRPEAGPTVFATFPADTDYLGRPDQRTMLNFRVADLDAMLAQLRAAGADVSPDREDMDGIGRFGWVTDPRATGSSSGSPPEPAVSPPAGRVPQPRTDGRCRS